MSPAALFPAKWKQYRLCLAVAEHQIFGGMHFLIVGPESGKIWCLKKVQIPPEKSTTANGPLLLGKKPKWIFQNFGNLLQPLEFVSASRERVVPKERQVRTVLGDCKSKAESDFNSSATVSAICADQ